MFYACHCVWHRPVDAVVRARRPFVQTEGLRPPLTEVDARTLKAHVGAEEAFGRFIVGRAGLLGGLTYEYQVAA